MTIEHLDIEQWILTIPDLDKSQINIVTCDECNGTGIATCDSCGHKAPCTYCLGEGEITDYGIYEVLYDEQLEKDKKAFKCYIKAIGDKR
jgi:hypothetical protein